VKVWDLVTGTELRSLGGHKQTVTAVMLLSTETSALLGQLVFHIDLMSGDCNWCL